MNVKEHWLRVHAKRAELTAEFPSGFLYTTTVENYEQRLRGGAIHQVSVAVAATGIVEGKLRISTAAEIEAYEKYCQQQREVLQRGERVREPKSLMVTVKG